MIACETICLGDTGIPDDVRRFVADEIHSLEQLEILLSLHRHASEWWTAERMADDLRTSRASVAARMADMSVRGLLEVQEEGPRYRYRPATPGVEAVVQLLDRLYTERRVSIITLIFSKPLDSIRDFSDAFRVRKGEGS
jgi:hypothetical protein